MDSLVDHKATDQALSKDEAFIELNGKRVRGLTTKGWKLCVQWKDSATSWTSLKDMKESYPVQLAKYAITNNIDSEPAFAWWVPYTLKYNSQDQDKVPTSYTQIWYRTTEIRQRCIGN